MKKSLKDILNEATSVLFPAGSRPEKIAPCDHYAGNEKFIQKAILLQKNTPSLVDITCDLEDGATVGKESQWLKDVVDIVKTEAKNSTRCGVRIHAPHETKLFIEEINSLLPNTGKQLSHITIPKIDSLDIFNKSLTEIKKICSANTISTPPIHVLIENLTILPFLDQIASTKEVRTLEFGIMDFISSLNGAIKIEESSSPKQFTNQLISRVKTDIVMAALRHGKTPVHNVTVDYKIPGRAFEDAKTARENFGFKRMWSIHPAQISEILMAFSVSSDKLVEYAELIKQAHAANWGPISIEGKLHDRASYRAILEDLETALKLDPSSIDKL